MQDRTSGRKVSISAVSAERRERRRAGALVLASLAVCLAAAPFARYPLPQVWAFIPIYESALAASDLITAALLFCQFFVLRTRALVVLAGGYLFTAAMIVPHLLSFPGLFTPTGLLGATAQTTAWLYFFWHGVFPLAVIGYALLKDRDGDIGAQRGTGSAAVAWGVVAVLALAAALTLLATAGHAFLPDIMRGHAYAPAMFYVNTTVWVSSLAALVVLWMRRPHAVLDLWLMVVMCAWLCDVALSAVLNAGRFDVGFYAGRIYGLLAASFVLVMLLRWRTLHDQFGRLLRAEHRERVRATAALEDSRAREHAVFASAFVGILILDEDGTIESINPAAERLFDLASDAAAGRDVGALIELDGPSDKGSGGRLRHLLGAGGVRELEGIAGDGSTFPIDLTLAEMPTADRGKFVAFVRDITGRRRAERIKDEFVATVSHELRTPLTSIAGSLGLLTGGGLGRLPAPAMRLIKIAHVNCQRLVRLVNDILDIERLDAGHAAFAFQRVDVKPLVEQAIGASRAFADDCKVAVTLERADEAAARADPDRLIQVVVNLLSNAIKCSPPDQRVMVAIENRSDHLRISVADHGPGIPAGFKARVFEKFAHADATDARAKGGTGLGLSIVRQIVLRHGGDVAFDDVPGGGTIFNVDLPTWDARVPASGPQDGGVPILVCEDDSDAADLLCAHLDQIGFAPEVAGTAADTVRAAAGKVYAAFLVDLHLPDGDGITVIEHLRAQWRYRNTPIVVVSANPEHGYEDQRAAALRVLDWMRKPVDFDRLARVLS